MYICLASFDRAKINKLNVGNTNSQQLNENKRSSVHILLQKYQNPEIMELTEKCDLDKADAILGTKIKDFMKNKF